MTGLMLLTCADRVYYRISPRCLCLYRGLSRLRSEVICSYLRLCCAVGPESAQCLIWIWNWLDARCWFRCLTSCLARCDLCWLDMAAVRFWQKQTRAEFCFWDVARENVKPYLELRRSVQELFLFYLYFYLDAEWSLPLQQFHRCSRFAVRVFIDFTLLPRGVSLTSRGQNHWLKVRRWTTTVIAAFYHSQQKVL